MKEVFLLLGSNLGEREALLKQAIQLISNEIAPVQRVSSVYETQSWGKTDEPDYLNQVVLIDTEEPAKAILDKILAIEREMGRERRERWGARVIDIDILFYGDEIIEQPGLHVPHPRLHERRFTLEPLDEIATHFVHPIFGKTISQLKTLLKDNLIVKKL
ncbi:2-amino-4-hydroxy-6-hydroxymethyldihydropteridine diphosphokinase [Mucilaginibacter limnophilus]|uniref:2-amino-4-hydroxy-6-hydroxymethyldihydropteridine pyrophosphokinase n=1 Tax=Mucilaginibacter limnophilus TaxID=1932778 RepID=A0A3S2VKE3_9SPHI|nr:2-amino-4-hydroxy-6-hydroxymethyldihydropteridine diphosphokinase [Mucilaginibacter limnophilus]RVT98072.1 2-amino-4-hydroxy-6-hydroxymethyldihydropteridine diphosphokinase [Mucilaginibacter limnophilus]